MSKSMRHKDKGRKRPSRDARRKAATAAMLAWRIMLVARKFKRSKRAKGGARRGSKCEGTGGRALSVGSVAVGSFALGASAFGALAVGAVAIRRLAVKRAAVGRLEVNKVKLGRLEVDELVVHSKNVHGSDV
jgi:hypothetical protein